MNKSLRISLSTAQEMRADDTTTEMLAARRGYQARSSLGGSLLNISYVPLVKLAVRGM
jgi:hypothetical protein